MKLLVSKIFGAHFGVNKCDVYFLYFLDETVYKDLALSIFEFRIISISLTPLYL